MQRSDRTVPLVAALALGLLAAVVFFLLVAFVPPPMWRRFRWSVADMASGFGAFDPVTVAIAAVLVVVSVVSFLMLARPAGRRGWSRLELTLAISSVAGVLFLAYVVTAPGYMAPMFA